MEGGGGREEAVGFIRGPNPSEAREAGWGWRGQEVRGGVCPVGCGRVRTTGAMRWCSGRMTRTFGRLRALYASPSL